VIKICHISTVHYVQDDRIFYKECLSLSKHYTVYLIAPEQKEYDLNGVHILPVPPFKNRFIRIFLGSFIALYKALFNAKAEIYHFHDPELILVGLILKLFGKKVIYDMHELVYESIADKEWLSPFLSRLLKKTYLSLEKLAIKKFDAIILAEDGYMPYFVKNYSNYLPKLWLIRNYPIVELIDNSANAMKKAEDKIRLIYMGGISRQRGIKELIMSLNRTAANVELMLIGNWDSQDLKNECEALEGWRKVNYVGFVNLNEIYKYLAIADVGISLLYPIKNYQTSLPVKVFEYMTMSKPVLMSDFPLWIEKFSTNAVFANPYDEKDIADKINQLLGSESLRKELGENGRVLIDREYSWKNEAVSLIEMYQTILRK
jgi:glycosyltransferase involved in cell wall biosynthesis